MTPNTIVLISPSGRHDEHVADNGNILPGHLLQIQSDNGVVPHAVAGGPGPMLVAKEDVFQGGTVNGVYNSTTATYSGYASGGVVMEHWLQKGDVFLGRIPIGASVTEGNGLMSNGDGTFIVAPGSGKLYEITAPSTVITNVGTETAFSNGTYNIPANFLQVGDVLHVRAKVFLIAVNSTNTHRIRLYIGATPVTIADSTAIAMVANDIVTIDAYITVRTITASGTIIATGTLTYTISGTETTTEINVASSTLDSTIAEPVTIKSLASATSAGNQIRLDEFEIDLDRAGGLNTLAIARETINNSSGSASALCRMIVV